MPCLDDNAVSALLEGKLSEQQAREAHSHLATCEGCRSLVAAVRASSTGAPELLTGQVLMDTYRVEHVIGSGAMGTVYAGEHVRLTRPVAIKVLGDRMRHHPDALERFKREAQVCSKLGNPHIVDVLDFNLLQDGTPFMVMERLEGEDLAQKLSIDGQLPPSFVVRLMRQIAAALANAHDEGVLHRDLKPSNIYLCHVDDEPPPFVKVLDFGISKVRGAVATLTGSQEILGTPFYMSPEMAMARHADVDQRSDLFSLGAIAYEALSCRRAFEADSIPGALYRIVHEDPEPLQSINPSLPAGLVRLVTGLLSKEKVERPGSARDVVSALESLGGLESRPREMTPVPETVNPYAQTAFGATPEAPDTIKTGRSRRWTWLGLVGAALVAATLVVVVMMGTDRGASVGASAADAALAERDAQEPVSVDAGPPADAGPELDGSKPAPNKTTKTTKKPRRKTPRRKRPKKPDTDPIL